MGGRRSGGDGEGEQLQPTVGGEDPVIRCTPRFGPGQGDDLAGVAFPVAVEGAGIEEREPGSVQRALGHCEHLGEQGGAKPTHTATSPPPSTTTTPETESRRQPQATRAAGPSDGAGEHTRLFRRRPP